MFKKLFVRKKKNKKGTGDGKAKRRAASVSNTRTTSAKSGSAKTKSKRSVSSAPKVKAKKQSVVPAATINSLPEELLKLVFRSLDSKTYLACVLTCKDFNKRSIVDYKAFVAEQKKAVQATKVQSPSASGRIKRADAYEWGSVLGKGAFGDVVSAVEKESRRKVAIKVLNKQHVVREKKHKYVKTERDILASTTHPNIISLYNTFQDKENLYYIMELAEEGELFHHLKKHGKFTIPVAAFYLAELILALTYLHSLGIVHRDVKPENILLAKDFHIRLTDFGTAKVCVKDRWNLSYCLRIVTPNELSRNWIQHLAQLVRTRSQVRIFENEKTFF
mmetsp:Transcript_30002/g.33499  ORF Transcript_30002/g.33499 Transcript_30002/m.33499 type:complete len:333 (-) Transcript_30002:344-1342(-)